MGARIPATGVYDGFLTGCHALCASRYLPGVAQSVHKLHTGFITQSSSLDGSPFTIDLFRREDLPPQ